MGNDPLAWLAEEDSTAKKAVLPPKRTRTRRTSRKKTATAKTEIELVEESFAALAPQGEALVSRFYEKLFEQNPKLAPLFDTVSVVGQQKKLLASLVLLVQNLDKPAVLKDYLLGLGARHMHYGVSLEQYQMFTDALISVMSEILGNKWTSQVNDAWQNTLNNVTTIMLEAYEPVEAEEMATNKQTDSQELITMRAAVDGASTALMMCDENRVITYANPAVMSLLQNRLTELRKVFPGLNLKKLIGTNIDDFHKDPSLQAGILSDVDNLPYQAQIQLLDIHFDLNASAIVDADGNYMGNMVEWKDITDQVNAQAEADRQAVEVSRLQSAIDGATTALMICNADRVITFANPSVMALLENRLTELRKIFPKIDLNKLLGTCIDDFHKDPSHQAKILADVDNLPYRSQIQLLDLHFDLNASAIVDADGNYMGNLVEWKDITDQVNAENAIKTLITAAGAGQLEERIDTSDYSGFMENIAGGINSIMDTVLAPVQETIRVSGALSNGDLTQNMDGEYQGLFATLADALNDSVNKMAETVQEINDTSTSIGTAASEISEGNVDLSQRTEQQASSLEETASSMEELTSTVRQNSDNARQANQLAASSREQAEKGGSVIKEAIAAMLAISTSSKKVTDIIGVIDEIAFQTNLLALNAAVEAARAGEQGRGFAVVASEVRNLAQRSASAAKEIKELINDSGEKVKEGSALVDESGRTLEEIVASSKKVGDIISEIAAAGAEQTQGIEQVTKAVGQMDEMTQQNAALVEQAAAASESLDDQGKSLQRLMSFFEVGDESDEPAPVVTARKTKVKPVVKKAKAKPKSTPKSAPVADDDDDEWDEF
ncbi:MAG: methyl-accepting chemotaxis protein [Gammaproteobacteria bacterium]|nr:MAG: methyl-accepting chemotaxis protein [Gammaproteobacteria bacterium]